MPKQEQLETRLIRNNYEVLQCVRMYETSPYGVDPTHIIDTRVGYRNLLSSVKDRNYFLIGCYRDKVLVGWCLCRYGQNSRHSGEVSVAQEYYVTDQVGIFAIKVLYSIHDLMEKIAINLRAAVVMSHASHLDKDFVLCRALAKRGWSVCGYVAYRRLPRGGPRLGVPETPATGECGGQGGEPGVSSLA